MHTTARSMLGESDAIQRVLRRIPAIARARRTTMISGPTGVGKEVVANLLHRTGSASQAPYIPVHCGALPEQLAESELFGHTKGAFTGASGVRPGLIRSARGGTLFLDEVDSLSLSVQAKLLRFLETGEYRPVGSDRIESADVWVLAATNSDLQDRVVDGRFRADLHYRLDVMRVELPALKLRQGDVELLARHFLQVASAGRCTLSASAVAALYQHDWPGNVRELKHRIERAAVLVEKGPIQVEDLDLRAPRDTNNDQDIGPARCIWDMVERDGLSLTQALSRCERLLIDAALRAEDNNRTRAAQRLGIHVRTIFKKLARE